VGETERRPTIEHVFIHLETSSAIVPEGLAPLAGDALSLGPPLTPYLIDPLSALDRRLVGYEGSILVSPSSPEHTEIGPLLTVMDGEGRVMFVAHLWAWQIHYQDAPVAGELTWSPLRGRFLWSIHDMGAEDSATRADVMQAWDGLQILRRRMKWGRPRGSGYFRSAEECRGQLLEVMRALVRNGDPITQDTVARTFGLSITSRQVRRWCDRYGLNWGALRREAMDQH
jgi:hypothetical protein